MRVSERKREKERQTDRERNWERCWQGDVMSVRQRKRGREAERDAGEILARRRNKNTKLRYHRVSPTRKRWSLRQRF